MTTQSKAKPVKAWAVKRDGDIDATMVFSTREAASDWLDADEAVIPVTEGHDND